MINSRAAGICSENLAYLEYGFSENFPILPKSEPLVSLHSPSLIPLSLHLSSRVWLHLGLLELDNVFLASKSSFRFLKTSMAWGKSSENPIPLSLKSTCAGSGRWGPQNVCLCLAALVSDYNCLALIGNLSIHPTWFVSIF